ncbi:hypothetical protein PIB30_042993 [Stylosanthes scabra]|uniref:Histone deacetylase complex subunit SAP30 Sin3 binding domain-containing protein n=1 Tax=Stylosanthes scabra TaxID=79078 RepID=A0ABU6TG28_9FABA|nr:hypothetical protein [Stylosanthes scabra]
MPVAVANVFVYQKMQIKTKANVSMMFSYHRGIASVFAIELCVQLQDVGGSSFSSNHVEFGEGFNLNEGARMSRNRRASSLSPSFTLRGYCESGDDEEFIPEMHHVVRLVREQNTTDKIYDITPHKLHQNMLECVKRHFLQPSLEPFQLYIVICCSYMPIGNIS